MKQKYLRLFIFVLLLSLTLVTLLFTLDSQLHAEKTADLSLWTDVSEEDIAFRGDRAIIPQKYRTVQLNNVQLEQLLGEVPQEEIGMTMDNESILSLPLPDGGYGRFHIVESPIMAPELAAKFPEIKTYAGQGIDDPAATLRFDVTPHGFHAQVLTPSGRWYIDPYFHLQPETGLYLSYFGRDGLSGNRQFAEPFVPEPPESMKQELAEGQSRSVGTHLRVHRLAQAATGEYTQYFGGTVPDGMAAIVTAVNRVTGIYEVEVAIRFQLVANNDQIVFTNPSTDPYPGAEINQANQTTIDSIIGDANYDIGHVFNVGGGGYVTGAMGISGQKARGNTGINPPTGDVFWVDFVAHEVGHQYTASHTWNGNGGNCTGGQWISSRAMEPGSASTIMGYAGICSSDNLQSNSDAYFHSTSFDQIVNWTSGGNPGNVGAQATGNNIPTANAGGNYTIPARTPFDLTGQGSDADVGDLLTYQWEQYDGSSQRRALNNPPTTNGPIFRSFFATSSPVRSFPKMSQIIANNTNAETGNCPALPAGLNCFSEFLPTADRTMTFRFTVRDNKANGGGVNNADMQVTVEDNAGPFLVTAPNTAVSWTGGDIETVSWNVAGTSAAPISCSNVNILLSTDGGSTYPVTVAANTPNDGSQSITVPNNPMTTARIRVECANNIFFDISNSNFTIIEVTDFSLAVTPQEQAICSGNDAVYTVAVGKLGGFNSNVLLTAPSAPGTPSFSPNNIQPPFNSTLTITGLGVGSYTFDVVGDGGGENHTDDVMLTVSAALPSVPTLSSPGNGDLDLEVAPTFSWSAVADTIDYDIQIATDSGFTSIFDSAKVTTNSYSGASLYPNQIYYWRVKSNNGCGSSSYSTTFSFKTIDDYIIYLPVVMKN